MKFTSKKENPKVAVVDIQQKLSGIVEAQKHSCECNGLIVAGNNPPKDQTDLESDAFCAGIQNAFEATNYELSSLIDQEIIQKKSTVDQISQSLSEKKAQSMEEIKRLESEKEKEIENKTSANQKDKQDKEELLAEAKRDHANHKTTLRTSKKNNTTLQNLVGCIIMFFILAGEVSMNQDAFGYAGFNELNAYFIGIGISAVTFMLGLTISYTMKKEWATRIKIITYLSCVATLIAIYYTMGAVRIHFMENFEDADGLASLTPMHFVFFNLGFFIAIFATKYFVFPDKEKVEQNNKYRAVKKNLKKADKNCQDRKSELRRIEQKQEQLRKVIARKYDQQIAQQRLIIDRYIKDLENAAIAYNKQLGRGDNFYKQINSEYKECIALFIHNINLYRKDGIRIGIPGFEPLENIFTNYKPIDMSVFNSINSKSAISMNGSIYQLLQTS